MQIWIYSLTSVFLLSLVSLLGVFSLSLKGEWLQKTSGFLVGVAVGALMGGALIHLIPHAFEELGHGLSTSLYIISGVILFFSLEKFVRWRHCHVSDTEHHMHPVAAMNLIGDGAHNFIDGMLIASAYHIGLPEGIAVTVGIFLHEIPQEIADFGVLIYSGLSVKKALILNFLTSLTALLGVLLVLLIPRSQEFSQILIPITAGCFLYIAGSDLVPELQHDTTLSTSIIQLISIILGVTIMALLAVFMPH